MTRPADTCHASGAAIEPGTPYVAVLTEVVGEDGEARVERLSYLIETFENGSRPETPVLAAWRSVMPEPNAAPSLPLGDLRDVFEQLEGTDAAAAVTLRYLIALVLMRKKKLVLQRTEGEELVLSYRGEDGETRVVDPKLDHEALAEASERLGDLIGIGGAS